MAIFFRSAVIEGGPRVAIFWDGSLFCLSSSGCGNSGSAGGETEWCRVGWEPTLHRRFRPGREVDLCFLVVVRFRGVFLGYAGGC